MKAKIKPRNYKLKGFTRTDYFKGLPKDSKAGLKALFVLTGTKQVKVSKIKTKTPPENDRHLKAMAYKKPTPAKKETKTTNQPAPPNKKRNFVGSGWDNSGNFGFFGNLQLKLEDLNNLPVDKYGNIRVTVATRKNPDERSGQDLMVYESESRA